MTSSFNMADVSVHEGDLLLALMATATLISNTGDPKVCKKKNLSRLFGAYRKNLSLGAKQ